MPRGAAKGSQVAKEADSVAQEVEELMADNPSVVNAGKKLFKAKHQVKHVIETTAGWTKTSWRPTRLSSWPWSSRGS